MAAEELGYPVVVKAQVQIGGRGKAGGIKVANDADEAEAHAKAILGMDIRGLTVHEVWVEPASDIAAEYYAAVVFDRSAKKVLMMLSAAGGVEIETVPEEQIARLHVDPLVGFQDFQGRRLAFESGIDADVVRPVGAMLAKLYNAFVQTDAMLVEVNPLIVTGDRQVTALDAKVTVDDNALPRQPRDRRDAQPVRGGPAGADGQGARHHLREARRRDRHPRERRRARDVHARRRRAGGRAARELPRRRRRRGGGRDRGGARGAALGREGEGGALQHLRRDHPLRRGRERDPPGARPDRREGADRRPARRHQRRGGPPHPRGGRRAPAAPGEDHARGGRDRCALRAGRR